MANLPPRPESPLRMPPREERRHLPDERDRDRRSALPMAPRYRGERYPERERPYAPRPILDSYVAPGYDSRRGPDRRDFDDRDRNRRDFDKDRDTRERDRRNWERQQRERERSPRRLNSPERDRDRRPFDRERGPPRRPSSPPRRPGPSRRSRSPPRRRFSRSPPPHYRPRNRTRSRSRSPYRSPPPHKRVRLGNHSIAPSPRSRSSRSPQRRRPSKERIPSSPKNRRDAPPHLSSAGESEQKELKTTESSTQAEDVPMDVTPIEPSGTVSVKPEEASSITLPPTTLPDLPIPNEGETKPVADATQKMETTITIAPTSAPEETKNEAKVEVKPDVKLEIKPEVVLEHSQPKVALEHQPAASPSLPHISVSAPQRTGDNVDVKMDNVESPKPSAVPSNNSAGSSPKPSPVINDYNRSLPTGPRYGGRSPPRGPRYRPVPSSQPPINSHQFTPRGPRRDYRSSTSSYSNPAMKSGVPLPQIPRYVKEKPLQQQIDLETELSRLQHHRTNLAIEYFQQSKGSRRALQELDMATIDLQAAENRRHIADMQLEKAKSGSLGIEAPLTDFAT